MSTVNGINGVSDKKQNKFTNTTVVVYDMGTEGTKIFLAQSDLSRFDGVHVNVTETGLEDELAVFDFQDEISSEEAKEAIISGAYLILCGFGY